MKKVALVFVVAVLAPSLVLAWLAVRSLRDQQFLLERQQSLLDQHVTDTLAQNIADYLAQRQQEFSAQVESLAAAGSPQTLATQFDDQLRKRWPLADVGFCVTAAGKIISPLPNARPAAQMFRLDNSSFLGNREPVEVYLTANNGSANAPGGTAGASSTLNFSRGQAYQSSSSLNGSVENNFVPPSGTPAAAIPSPQNLAPANGRQFGGRGGGGATDRSVAGDSSPSAAPLTNALVAATDAAAQQAFAIDGNAAKKLGQMNNAGRNGFYLAPAAQASQPQRPSSNAQGHETRAPQLRETNPAMAAAQQLPGLEDNLAVKGSSGQSPFQNTLNYKAAESRKVSPQSQKYLAVNKAAADNDAADAQDNLSKVVPAEAEFRQLIGDQTDGMFARFLQNKLKLMCWHRLGAEPDLIFGAQLNLDRLVDGLRGLVHADRSLGDDICLAVLDDGARPVVLSREQFQANWKRPFVATEVGDALPHWEVAAYLVNPAQLTQAAQTAKLTLGLLIAVLVIAIGIGSLLIVRGLEAELKLARQKTDFVSNVSHELKTPLTSIRMFSELLAEGRVADPAKQHSYLQIITAEAGRLTRLINNVLDFSRMERGEKKYSFQPCDLSDIVRATAETFRPHLDEAGFKFACEVPVVPIPARGDPDALSQIIVNLLSNAEKYSNGGKEILLQLAQQQSPLPHAEIRVQDRGPGVPRGSEEKIFEKFYRAHDSLSSGVQGSGLGLTLARQIARAHGGDVVYEPREGGGSCFILRLPISSTDEH
jgi:signal transduction histidine kinase